MLNQTFLYTSRVIIICVALLMANNSYAFGDDDLERVNKVFSKKRSKGIEGSQQINELNILGAPTIKQQSTPTKTEMIDILFEAYSATLQKCEGRFSLLAIQKHRQIRTSEWVAITGGVLGVIGTIATCPHCAAAMSGLAGLANPIQSTIAQNNDTPQTTQAILTNLANKINDEVNQYNRLSPPNPADNDSVFYSAYMAKREQLLLIATSCLTFSHISTSDQNGGQAGSGQAGDK